MARIVLPVAIAAVPLSGCSPINGHLLAARLLILQADCPALSCDHRPVDLGSHPRNHVPMDFEDASPRARPGDLIAQLAREDLDPLSVAELDGRVAALTAEIERTRAKRDRAVNHKASADALFKK